MKKTTLENIRNYLNGDTTIDLTALRDEVNAEYEKLAGKAREKANAYEIAKPIVFGVMGDPMTVKEIYAKCANDLPDGFTAAKIQYAFLHYWSNEIVKHDNGKSAFTYTIR